MLRKSDFPFGNYFGWFLGLVGIWVFHFIGETFLNGYYLSIAMYAGINIVLAVSLNLINGFTGQFSMGHAGFMSVGGYVAALISTQLRSQGLDVSPLMFACSTVGGACVAGLAGYCVGLPSLRLKGDYLAIVTLGFGEIIRVIVLNTDMVGGARGFPDIPKLANLGWIYTWGLIALFIIWRILHSKIGREFMAVRDDEIAAESMGVNTTRAKVKAFVIGAAFAGVAGSLMAHTLSFLAPSMFDFNKSFEIIIMVVLGGMGSLTGSVLAALFLTILPEALRPLQDWTGTDLRMVIYSLILIIMMLTRPSGLLGKKEWMDFFRVRA